MAKNEHQRMQNLARSQQGQGQSVRTQTQTGRKREIERTLATTRASTASMGKFDRVLEGDKKPRGVKRKVAYRFPSFSLTPPYFHLYSMVSPFL